MPEPSRRKTSRVATTAAGAAKRAGPEAPTGGAAKGAAPEQAGGGAAKRAAPKPPGRRPLAAVAQEQAAEGPPPTPRRRGPGGGSARDGGAGGPATAARGASRWMERLLPRHDPALTVAQYLALQAVAGGGASGGELARRTGVSGPAVSQ